MEKRRWSIPMGRVALGAVVLALMFAAIFRAFRGHVFGSWSDPDDWRIPAAMAAFATVFAYLTLLALAAVLQGLGERKRTEASAGGAAFRDGEFAAVDGKVRALGEALVAPFSGKRCVAYEYTVWMGQGSIPGRRRNPDAGRGWAGLAGVALAPSVIDGYRGPVKLLGFSPLGVRFPTQWFKGHEAEGKRGVRRLIDGRKYETLKGMGKLRLVTQLFDLQSDDDGALRKDWCLDENVLDAPESVLISESVIAEGDRVGASGLWSEARQGLYGHVGRVGFDVWPGNLEDRRRRLLLEPMGRLAFLAMCCAGLGVVISLVWRSTEEVEGFRRAQAVERARASFTDVIWKDPEATRAALRAGIPVDRRDHYGNTLLMEAAHQHDAGWVKLLLEEGADVHAANPRWGTALDQAIRARARGREEVIALLKAAGARDFRVGAGNGHAVPAGGGAPGAAIAGWYRAIEAGDLAALNARFVSGDLSDIDWELWRLVRPLGMEAVEGFENEGAATVTVRGRDTYGRARTWGYHLVRPPAGADWRIRYEWEMD
jgi:ankyrin repeat protein